MGITFFLLNEINYFFNFWTFKILDRKFFCDDFFEHTNPCSCTHDLDIAVFVHPLWFIRIKIFVGFAPESIWWSVGRCHSTFQQLNFFFYYNQRQPRQKAAIGIGIAHKTRVQQILNYSHHRHRYVLLHSGNEPRPFEPICCEMYKNNPAATFANRYNQGWEFSRLVDQRAISPRNALSIFGCNGLHAKWCSNNYGRCFDPRTCVETRTICAFCYKTTTSLYHPLACGAFSFDTDWTTTKKNVKLFEFWYKWSNSIITVCTISGRKPSPIPIMRIKIVHDTQEPRTPRLDWRPNPEADMDQGRLSRGWEVGWSCGSWSDASVELIKVGNNASPHSRALAEL